MAGAPTDGSAARCCLRDACAASISYRSQGRGIGTRPTQTCSTGPNNTSAFTCRGIPGTTRWSHHAYGRAIDLNPLLNPYIDATGAFQPENSAAYLDRSRTDPALLHSGDLAVRAFTDRDWRWGGHWRAPIDYQHFERP